MRVRGAKEKIEEVILDLPGVAAGPHRFGGTVYRLGRREIGHLHGDRLLDVPFPRKVRDELVEAGRAEPHHARPKSGWVSLFLREEADVESAVELLKMSYGLAKRRG